MIKKRVSRRISRYTLAVQVVVVCLSVLALLFFRWGITGNTIFESQPGPSDGKDSYIRQDSYNNFGTGNLIDVGKTGLNKDMRGLIEFNVSSIGSANTVVSAVVSLYLASSSGAINLTIEVYPLTSYWNESSVNWFNYSVDSVWASAGGDYGSLLSSVQVSNNGGWYNFSVSSAVRNWVNGSSPNYGLIFVSFGASAGDYKEFYSSDYSTDSSLRPKLIVNYEANANPTLDNLSVNSFINAPISIGGSVTFTANWSDLDGAIAQLFICNSTSVSLSVGCLQKTYCNTSQSSQNPVACSYSVLPSDNRTTKFWATVCDFANCSSATNGTFYVNHASNLSIIQPNGGETINQSLGDYRIRFNVSDTDNDALFAGVYYGLSSNSTTFTINSSVNLTGYCTDGDNRISTTNNCSYLWNSTGIYGTYYLTIIVNDSFSTVKATSGSSFNVVSLTDAYFPLINASWISEEYIYSGKRFMIYANITEENPSRTWITINTTPTTTLNMSNISSIVYNVSFVAPAVGSYEWIVYSRDVPGNQNSTFGGVFNVSKPNASFQSITSPAVSQPYSVIRVSSQLNASDALRSVQAYLYAPSEFTFLEGYNQSKLAGNFSANETKTTSWMVSSPLEELNYSLNATYTDYYGNSWNGSNSYTRISSAASEIYSLFLAGYPEVETSGSYLVQSVFRRNGLVYNADSVFVSIYDGVGSLVVGPAAMTPISAGIYNYTYSVGASVVEGQWQTIVNATKSGVSYAANKFWKVVGGPFDVRDITVLNSAVNLLNISVVTENTGGATKDLTLVWNLTREDNAQVLASGADTFAVGAYSQRIAYVHPITSYVGQVKITFIGYYARGTERAGAFKVFETTAASNGSVPSAAPGGGGGGGGAVPAAASKGKIDLKVERVVYVTKNIAKNVSLFVTNNLGKTANTIRVSLDGLPPDYYRVYPSIVSSLANGSQKEFIIRFFVSDAIGELPFNYVVSADGETHNESAVLVVLSMKDFLERELGLLKSKLEELKSSVKTDEQALMLSDCERIISEIELQLKNEEYISVNDNLAKLDDCLKNAESRISQPQKFRIKIDYEKAGIILAIILVILLLIWIARILYKRSFVLSYMRERGSVLTEEDVERKVKDVDRKLFDEKIADIQRKLGLSGGSKASGKTGVSKTFSVADESGQEKKDDSGNKG